jgi:hypothetical protein
LGSCGKQRWPYPRGRRRLRFWPIVKNLDLILKKAPFARRKAEAYLGKLIQLGQEIGASGFMHSPAARHPERLHPLNRSQKPAGEGRGVVD